MTIPTKLILLRIFLIPVFLVLFFSDWEFSRISAIIVFAIASISDLFDGIIARARGQMTDFIKVMDPLADKLLICSALIALVWAHSVPAWLVILIVCRDFIITGFRLFAASKNTVLGAVLSGKFNTCFQMFLVLAILLNLPSIIITILMWTVVVLTIVSTAENFIRNKDILKQIKI